MTVKSCYDDLWLKSDRMAGVRVMRLGYPSASGGFLYLETTPAGANGSMSRLPTIVCLRSGSFACST